MKKRSHLLISAALTGSFLWVQPSTAQILHEATFDRNGIREVINVHTDGGEISVVNNPDGSGKVLKAYRDQNDRRAEVRIYSCELDEYWYGFRLFVPNNYPGVTRRTHINQWHPGGGSEPEGGFRKIDGNGQPYGFKIDENDEFVLSFAYLVATNTLQYKYIHTGIKWTDHKGKWLNWAIHANWSTSNDGFAEVFFEGRSVGRYEGKTWGHLGEDPMWKAGSYSGTLKGDATLYFDDFYVGNERASLSDVNPRLSNGGDGGGNTNEQTAYQGPHTIPGKLEAEHYDNGGEGVAFRDTDAGNRGGCGRNDNVDLQAASDEGGGCNVGWTRGGEWLEYTMARVSEGTYNLNVRLASGSSSPGTLTVKLAGRTLGTIDVANTGGWQNYVTRTLSNLRLSQGSNQVLRLEITQGSFNLNWLDFATVAPAPNPTALNFSDYSITSYDVDQDENGSYQVQNGGATLRLTGNTWKKIAFAYRVTPSTRIAFDYQSSVQGEVQGIGLDENNDFNDERRVLDVYGSQNLSQVINQGEHGFRYTGQGGWQSFDLPVGQWYTGQMSFLSFVNDDDDNDAAVGAFRNVRVYEGGSNARVATANSKGALVVKAEQAPLVQMYPNPATGTLTVKATESSAQEVQMVNLQGQLLLRAKLSAGQAQLDVSTLPKGLYLVKVGQHSERIILE